MELSQQQVRLLAQQFGSLDSSWECCDLYTKSPLTARGAERARLLMRIFYLACTSPDHAVCEERMRVVQKALLEQWGALEAPRRVIAHPWTELDHLDHIPLLGFGSLINWMSSSADLESSGVPALTFGMRRVFNYGQDQTPHSFNGQEVGGDAEHAKLNAIYSGDVGDVINGLLYNLTPQELSHLRFRERGYDLVEVPIVTYADAFGQKVTEPSVRKGYMLMVPEHLHAPENLRPHVSYLHVCIEGAHHNGPAFVDLFLRSTYIADKETTLKRWLYDVVSSDFIES